MGDPPPTSVPEPKCGWAWGPGTLPCSVDDGTIADVCFSGRDPSVHLMSTSHRCAGPCLPRGQAGCQAGLHPQEISLGNSCSPRLRGDRGVGTPGFHPALCCVTGGQRPLTSCVMHNLQQGPRTRWVHARVALHTVWQGLRLPTGLDTRCCSVKFQVPRPLTSAQEERGPSERGSLLGLTGKIRF